MEPSSRTDAVVGQTNIHLDFHNPDFAPEVGTEFDPERFGRRLDEADVDSIALFAKCCQGYSYYDTDVGVQHPSLEFDLLEAQIEACHERDITVLAYYGLGYDNRIVEENPDWYQRDGNGDPIAAVEPDDRWDYVCLNTPYIEEQVHPQVEELLEYDLDGLWFDILLYHEDTCTCRYCVATMNDADLDPGDPEDRRRHRAQVCESVARRTTRKIKEHDPELITTYNHRLDLGLTTALDEHMDYVVIESLPERWGYLHTPMMARYTRNLDRPVQGMTAIFHEHWGDFGSVKHPNQLKYELANSLAHHLPVSVGDQLRPRGELEPAKYDAIGEAFRFAKERKLPAATPVRDVALLFPGEVEPAGRSLYASANGAIGATKLLCDAHQQFDVFDEELAAAYLEECSVAVLPETGPLDPSMVETIREFVETGGSLLATGTSSLEDGAFALGDVLGIRHEGRLPYSTSYVALEEYDEGVPDLELPVYGGFQRVALEGASASGAVVAPTNERTETRRFSHFQGPPERTLDAPAITRHEYGDGEAVYVGTDLFTQYFTEDYYVHRTLLDNVVTSLQSRRTLDVDGPASLEVNAMRTGDATYVHLTNYHTARSGEYLPQIDTQAQLATDVTVRVFAPEASNATPVTDADVSVNVDGDYLAVDVEEVGVHEVVRVE